MSDKQGSGQVILQVLPALDVGGVERGTVDMAAAITKAGGTALVACAGGVLEKQLKEAGGTLIRLPLGGKDPATILANAVSLRRLIRSHGVALVHARSRAPAWSALMAARAERLPLVTTFHGTYNFSNSLKRFYNSVMTKGDRVIAVSNFIAKHIEDNYRIDKKKIRVVYRGVDLDKFDPDGVSNDRVDCLRHLYHIDPADRVVLLPARLTRWKGHEVLLNAMAECKSARVVALMVGPDRKGYRQRLETETHRLGLSSRIRIADTCPDLPAAYALSAMVVIASTEPEAFNRTTVEAQAMGKPVIATAIGALPELVKNGETGFLVPASDSAAMAHAIDTVLALSGEAYADMSYRGRSAARPRFSVDHMTAATLDVYRELLPQGRP